MQCSISGEQTSQPVLSPKSNMIFDRSIAENYVAKNGKDPITNEPLTVDDLIPVKVSSALNNDAASPKGNGTVKSPGLTSIPSLLTVFQNEWDAIVLENFELKKKIHNLKQDLASSVYHYDASIRVISRLTKEKDDAVRKLQETLLSINNGDKVSANVHAGAKGDHTERQPEAMDIDEKEQESVASPKAVPQARSDNLINDSNQPEEESLQSSLQPIVDAEKFLNTIHQKQLKENKSSLNTTKHTLNLKTLLPFTAIDHLQVPATNQLSHSSIIFSNEILLLSNRVSIFVVNLSLNSLVNKFKITELLKTVNKKSCEVVAFNFVNISNTPDSSFKPVVGLDDGSSYIIDTDLSKNIIADSSNHAAFEKANLLEIAPQESQAPIVTLLSHPSLNSYLIRVYANGIWAIVNCFTRKTLFKSTFDTGSNFEFSSADLHMDGSLLAIGTSTGLILIYDLKTGDKLTTFQESVQNPAEDNFITNNLVFANNGYWLLSTLTSFKHHNSKIDIWDLRKGQISTTISSNKIVKKIAVDKFSQILTILFQDNTVEFFKYLKKSKQWERDLELSESFKGIVENEFGEASKSVHLLNVYWQKTFDRDFYLVKSDGKWGKFAIDFE